MITNNTRKFKNSRGVLFDLDGTLLDSYPVHFRAYQAMFARFGIPITEETFLATYSPDWYRTYEVMGLPKKHWELANTYWMEEASKQAPALLRGVKETLAVLRDRYKLGIVTSGSRSRVMRDLETNGIHLFFQAIVAGDDVQKPKPSPEGLEFALLELQIRPGEAVYVGDTQTDFEMAQRAKVPFVGIPSNFGSLKPETPCFQVATITDLRQVF